MLGRWPGSELSSSAESAYARWLQILGLADDPLFADQHDRARWPQQAQRAAEVFAAHPREHWERKFDLTDACTTPVLSMAEAPVHPHMAARSTLNPLADDMTHPAAAPRFSVTPASTPSADEPSVENVVAALVAAGICRADAERLA